MTLERTESLLVVTTARKFRSTIPREHQLSLDTRYRWLWNQRFGTVQTIWQRSPDYLDKTACTLVLQAILGKDLESIRQLLSRLEGGPVEDQVVLEITETEMKL